MKTMQPSSKTYCILSFLILALAFSSINAASLPKNVKIYRLATVDPRPGKANFTTISAAVAAAPSFLPSTAGYYVVLIAKGVYPEYITIAYNQMYVMLIGAGIGKTIITGNKNVVDLKQSTYYTATFAIAGQGFVAQKISFRNTAGGGKGQAVAVRNEGDRSAFYQCSFEGYKDTLYAFSGLQYYKKCDIYGTVDVVLGNAAAVFQQCNIYSRAPLPGEFNTITAQARSAPTQNTGFVFQMCNIMASSDLPAGAGQPNTYLGRPWGTYARTVFIKSNLGPVINQAGWASWPGADMSSTVYYAEYGNTGPGAAGAGRVKWAGFHLLSSAADVAPFTVENFIQGKQWLPPTGVSVSYGVK